MTEVRTITGMPIGKYELTLVAAAGIPHVFETLKERFEEVFEERNFREYDIDELYRRLAEGEAQLWLVGEKGARLVMVGVTRILRYPSVKRLSVDIIMGEDLEGCAVMMEFGANWARQFGCTEIEAACRPGVRKVMEKHGFVKAYEVIVKPISGSTH